MCAFIGKFECFSGTDGKRGHLRGYSYGGRASLECSGLDFQSTWRSFESSGGIKMKHSIINIGIAALIFFSVVVGIPGYWMYEADRPFREARHYLLHNVDYHAVSVACLDLLTQPQYKPLIEQDPEPAGNDPRLPAAIRGVKAININISTNANKVVFMKTSGFLPMVGLIFRPSANVPNAYELVYREGSPPGPDALLYTLTNAADLTLTPRPLPGFVPQGASQ